MTEEELYMRQMESWFKEQAALERQLATTIETSTQILAQNKIQLELHVKRTEIARKDFQEWSELNIKNLEVCQ